MLAKSASFRLAALAVSLALGIWGVVLAIHGRGIDFRVYLTAAERFARGESLYLAADGPLPFKYAPSAAWLFWPLAQMPTLVAGALWSLIGAAVFFGTVQLVAGWFRGRRAWPMLLATLALSPSFYFELFYGQVDLLMLALLVVALSDVADVWAAAAFAVAVQFKPPALLVVLLWLWDKQWRRLGFALAGAALLWLPVLLRYGRQSFALVAEWQSLLAQTSPPWMMGHNPQGLPTILLSLFYRLDAIPTPASIIAAQGVSMGVLMALVIWRRPPLSILRALACFGVAFLSPLAWRANFVLAWPMMFAAFYWPKKANLFAAAAVFIAGVLVNEGVLGVERYRTIAQFRLLGLALLAVCWVVSGERNSS